jgi:hypothetical protein
MQIDEFNFAFLGRQLKTDDLHLAFSDIHLAFTHSLLHKFPLTETEATLSSRKNLEKFWEQFKEINPNNMTNDKP